jgi:hypothetical protein
MSSVLFATGNDELLQGNNANNSIHFHKPTFELRSTNAKLIHDILNKHCLPFNYCLKSYYKTRLAYGKVLWEETVLLNILNTANSCEQIVWCALTRPVQQTGGMFLLNSNNGAVSDTTTTSLIIICSLQQMLRWSDHGEWDRCGV